MQEFRIENHYYRWTVIDKHTVIDKNTGKKKPNTRSVKAHSETRLL